MRAALIRGLTVLGGLGLWGAGCSETAGRAVAVPVSARGAAEGGGPVAAFTNARGWAVTLEAAHALIGPIYFAQVPPEALAWGWLAPIKAAHAHVLAVETTTVGELLAQYPVDLLRPEGVSLGVAQGQLGTCRRMELHLRPLGAVPLAPGFDPAPLRGHALWAAGEARRDGQVVRFAAGLDLPDDRVLQSVTDIRVDSVRFDDARAGGPRIRVQVEDWFWQADFATLPAPGPDGLSPIPADSPVAQGWLRAATHPRTYDLEWSP